MAAAAAVVTGGGDGDGSGSAPGRAGSERPASRPCPGTPSAGAFLAKEQEYRRLNAELEAKTAELVRQAEEVMRDQREALSRPISAQLEWMEEAATGQREFPSPEQPPLPVGLNKPLQKRASSSAPDAQTGTQPGKAGRRRQPSTQRRARKVSGAADVAVPDFSLAKTIGKIEGQLEEEGEEGGSPPDLEEDLIPGGGIQLGAEAQIRFLKAKLRVMQEELDAVAQECAQKEDENRTLRSRLKEVDEEGGRLQRAHLLQQSHLEKYKALSEEAKKKSEGLQQKLSGLEKELEALKRAQKQTSASQGTTEVRLNRALEESEKYKTELNRLKQSNKDVASQDHRKLEELRLEKKRLEKQKEELTAGFKKQLKLIDVLKRQKMHVESAKMLSFTEEEFMKALEWRNAS